jgi:adenine-specific DNA-methyltransferase
LSLMRPDVGTQAQFKKKPPVTYRYDSSLSPAFEWDGKNAARDQGEALIRDVLQAKSLEDAEAAADKLRGLGQPFSIEPGTRSGFRSTCQRNATALRP